jgi:hypothetical protein
MGGMWHVANLCYMYEVSKKKTKNKKNKNKNKNKTKNPIGGVRGN